VSVSNQLHKELLYIASQLPVVMDWSHEKHIVSMEEAKEQYPDRKDSEFLVFNKGKHKGKVLITFPVQVASNHYRRMKKAYLKSGQPGVIEYIKKVKALEQEQAAA
jgi:hypothetical protein